MALSTKVLTLLVFISLGLDLLLLMLVGGALWRLRRRRTVPHAAPADRNGPLLEEQAGSGARLETALSRLSADARQLDQRLQGAVQRVGLLRYDAFEDVGGRLSFSCALLDDRGDGVVITSINGRRDTRVYAKAVRFGIAAQSVSAEEEQAIRQALSGSREAVEAR